MGEIIQPKIHKSIMKSTINPHKHIAIILLKLNE